MASAEVVEEQLLSEETHGEVPDHKAEPVKPHRHSVSSKRGPRNYSQEAELGIPTKLHG